MRGRRPEFSKVKNKSEEGLTRWQLVGDWLGLFRVLVCPHELCLTFLWSRATHFDGARVQVYAFFEKNILVARQ